jgi:D-threonate/D-erythronate kinase
MIVVIADDITGAAEIGGLGLGYGLQVVLSDDVNLTGQPDLLVVYTNTRSMKQAGAASHMQSLTKKAKALQPSLFYKKTDSVLRGHVLAELKEQMVVLNLDKALLVPANPAMGRKITNGEYYINDQPIHNTGFSLDPEFPIGSSEVKQMLGTTSLSVSVSRAGEETLHGVVVGAASTDRDIDYWTRYNEPAVLLAGGAAFFNALLNTLYKKTKRPEADHPDWKRPLLLASGTTYPKSMERIAALSQYSRFMPHEMLERKDSRMQSAWKNEVSQILDRHNCAIAAIGSESSNPDNAQPLQELFSELVGELVEQTGVKELLIEGGSTAYAIVKNLGWDTLLPVQELQQGVVRMKLAGSEDKFLTIKPGSYDWPVSWPFHQKSKTQ